MYGENHIKFLQHMIKKGCINTENALNLCQELNNDDQFNSNQLDLFISTINPKINDQSLKLVIVKCEVTEEEYLILMSTAHDNVSKLQNQYTAIELEYFQTIMKTLITTDKKSLTQNACLNISSTLTANLSISNAENLLRKWNDSGYLVIHDGIVFLGPRSILEYTSYFRQHCKDYINDCNLCRELLFFGATCSTCKKKMHQSCINKFLKRQKKCPNCKKEWNAEIVEFNSQSEEFGDNNESSDDTEDSSEEVVPAKSKRA